MNDDTDNLKEGDSNGLTMQEGIVSLGNGEVKRQYG